MSHHNSELLPAEVTMISSFSRSAKSRKQASKFISSLPAQHFAREADHHRPRHDAAVLVSGRKARNVVGLFDRNERDIDRLDYGLQIEPVGLMKLGAVARPAAERDADQERDLVGVVDLGDGVDAGEESGRPHQGERADAAEERS